MSTERRGGPPRKTTGDLFAHFGVDLGPTLVVTTESAPTVPTLATSCRGCGWYVLASELSCPLCRTVTVSSKAPKAS